MTAANIKDLKPADKDRILEAKVYRAWIHRDPPDTTDKCFRAILLDKQGDAIQANMDASEINHFTPIVVPGKTCRISGFTCIQTENWQQTLQNKTSLKFTRFTKFDDIEDTGFPNHYFDFISYNQLPYRIIEPNDRTKKPHPVLTDYIGCYMGSTETEKIGNPNRNQVMHRKIEIQNLNRNSVELTLWGNLAETFNKDGIDAMEKPVIIAVSSCRVSRFRNRLQLSATPATYYYIDPNIPELEQYKTEYRAVFNLIPPLQIVKQPFKDKKQEKFRNRFPLAILMEQPPHTYAGVRFTYEGTVQSLNTSREWYYKSCSNCSAKVDKNGDTYECRIHGPVLSPTHRYNFKAYITDNTHTGMMTFFTPKADDLVGIDCHSLVTSLENPDPKQFPEKIEAIVEKTHIFQFHYNIPGKQGPPDFIFNEILIKVEAPKQLEGKASGSTSEAKQYEVIEYAKNTEPPMAVIVETVTPNKETIPKTPERITTQQQHSEGMATPPSKTEATSENIRKTTKRPLFTEEPSDSKKKKT